VLPRDTPGNSNPPIYIYGDFFKFSSLHQEAVDGVDVFKPAPSIDMFLLHRHLRSNRSRMGDIMQLTDIREVVELVPRFGARMDEQLNCDNSLDIPESFYLNNFADKETFHAILTYQ
jgi:hypothetical protein